MANDKKIVFNRPHFTGKEFEYISDAHKRRRLAGDGYYSDCCHKWIEENTSCIKALLTHSCTAALEMAALLLNIENGDEIIMPSYTFVSTANAFVLRGGTPVFVDVREDTLNIDENLIEEAITPSTKAIVPVHYAGVSCEMDKINEIAKKYKLTVVEDAAQGVMAKYKGKPLGSMGDLGTLSFHETKNVISGEGGAFLINSKKYISRAEIIREKGTNRSKYYRGEVDKYAWQEVGSSYLPGELIAAFLFAQLENADNITNERLSRWNYYHDSLLDLENKELLRRPIIPKDCQHNGHMYYILLPNEVNRQKVIDKLKQEEIYSVFHYVPLHSSPGGKLYGRAHGNLSFTNDLSERIVRLPLWVDMTQSQQDRVVEVLCSIVCN